MVNRLAPRLKDPPIVEVVCGFFFPALPGLDPLFVGKYWAEVKEKAGFRRGPLQPAVSDRPGIVLGDGVGPLRSWLVSETDEYVLQIQADRVYFNWRRRQGEYPHFRNDGGKEGVLTKSVRELAELSAFCEKSLGVKPAPVRLELAKIDQLVPLVLPIAKIARSAEPIVNLNVIESRDGHDVLFQMTNAALGPGGQPSVQLETRTSAPCEGGELADSFRAMNDVVNEVFFGMIDDAASGWARFGGPKA
jgi:hypothetical protein